VARGVIFKGNIYGDKDLGTGYLLSEETVVVEESNSVGEAMCGGGGADCQRYDCPGDDDVRTVTTRSGR